MNFNLFENNWIDYYNKKKIVNLSEKIITRCIEKIYYAKIDNFYKQDLNKEEINLLLRWSIYVSTNTFLDRLLNVSVNKNFFFIDIKKEKKINQFRSTIEVSSNYYNNFNLNSILIEDLYKIIYSKRIKVLKTKKYPIIDQDYKIKKIKKSIYSKIYNLFYKICSRSLIKISQKIYKVSIFYEGDKWFNNIFSASSRFPEHRLYKNVKISNKNRKKLKQCLYEALNEEIKNLNLKFNNKKLQKIIILFSKWTERSISTNVFEDLDNKISFYNKLINKNKIKEIHSCTGYYFNDNFKIFCILAKRRKVSLFAQDDGVDNYLNYFPTNKTPYQYKGLNQLRMVDFYCAWGKGKIYDGYNKVQKKFDTKIFNTGSVYLNNLPKKNSNKEININNFTIFYPSGPMRMFRASLEEVSPQKNFKHKIQILNFLKSMFKKYPGMKLIYKSFMGTDLKFDPITDILKNEIKSGRLKIYFDLPIKLMPHVDITLFDMISTGFAEAININTPAIVFDNKEMKNTISKKGLKVNHILEQSHCLFYNKIKAEKSFEFVLKDTKKFNLISQKGKDMFLKDLACPVSKEKFIANYTINAKH